MSTELPNHSYLNSIICGDCADILPKLAAESVDLCVTSPPYDNLRTYQGYSFDFERIAKELYRVIKPGGVMVWVVADATIKGSETGTGFRHALFFKEIGLFLHDTMIWEKLNPIPLSHNRYDPAWEFMFVLSKGVPKTFNPLKEKCRSTGHVKDLGRYTYADLDSDTAIRRRPELSTVGEFKMRTNIWRYGVGGKKNLAHPAVFPAELARDHIRSWSNEGDVVLDPLCGSGTVCEAAKVLNRNFIGIEISAEYAQMARARVNQPGALPQNPDDSQAFAA